MRSRSSRATCRARSARTSSRPAARLTPSRRSSSTRALDTLCRAASMAAKTPASGTRQIAITSSVIAPEVIGPYSSSARLAGRRLAGHGLARGRSPAVEELLLETEHLLLLVGLHVVVPEQVQHAMGGQQHQFVVHGMAGCTGLTDGD